MFLFIFFALITSKPIHLTDSNFTEFVNSTNLPIFLKLWATWCPHCKEMAPIWDELSELAEFDDRVYIADIECEENRKSCKSYPGDNFPRLYWVDQVNKTVTTYTGTRTLPHFQMFIEKQLHFPILPVNKSELNQLTETANLTSVFLFKLHKDDVISLNIAKKVSSIFRSSEIRFVSIGIEENEDQKTPQLIAYNGINRFRIFEGNFTSEKELQDFVLLNSVPFMVDVNAYVMRFFISQNVTTFMRVTNISKAATKESIEICEKASRLFPTSQTNCAEAPWFCRFVDIDLNITGEKYVLYNRAMQLYWLHNHSNENNNDSIENVLNWAINVSKNAIKPKGPGVGLFSPLFSLYYNQKSQGNPVIVVFIPPVLVIILALYMLKECFASPEIKEKTN